MTGWTPKMLAPRIVTSEQAEGRRVLGKCGAHEARSVVVMRWRSAATCAVTTADLSSSPTPAGTRGWSGWRPRAVPSALARARCGWPAGRS